MSFFMDEQRMCIFFEAILAHQSHGSEQYQQWRPGPSTWATKSTTSNSH